MKQTPLYENHKTAGAKFTEFGGFNMPVSYGVIKDEWQAVREKAGLFDISHMLPIYFKHSDPKEIVRLLNYVCARDITTLKTGKVIYNALVNTNGGVIDDITIYRIEDNRYMLIANAGNRDKVFTWLNKAASDIQSAVQPEAAQNYVLIALQGPEAFSVISKIYKIPEIYFYETAIVNTSPEIILSRTGYTGEDGCEILLPAGEGIILFEKLVKEGVKLCGLAARDLLRLEAFYPLYGHELAEDLNPFESGIGRVVNNPLSVAGEKLLKLADTPKMTLGFFLNTEGIPRQGFKIMAGDTVVGEVTSGGFSFLWNKGFGMCRIEKSALDKKCGVDIRGSIKEISFTEKSPLKGSIVRRPKKDK